MAYFIKLKKGYLKGNSAIGYFTVPTSFLALRFNCREDASNFVNENREKIRGLRYFSIVQE